MAEMDGQEKIKELHTHLTRVKQQNRRLWFVGIILGLSLIVLGLWLYNAYVFQYAVLKEVKLEQSPSDPRQVVFTYQVVKPGLIKLWHGQARLTSEVKGESDEPSHVTWRWDNRGRVEAGIRYRWWIFPRWDSKKFRM